MEKKMTERIGEYRRMDWAEFYMRLFTGAMMLFHNIGKIQNYNEIIGSYPALLHIEPAEVLLAVLIIMGLWVRPAAFLMAVGILLMFVWGGFGAGEQEFVWLGVYVFLIISGGGFYGFDTAIAAAGRKK